MFKVKVLSVGKNKEEWLKTAIGDYENRLRGRLCFEWIFVKTDADLIAEPVKGPLIALDPNGELFPSEVLSEKLWKIGLSSTFAIGGAEGLPKELLQKADYRWSLSPLTFTHQMTRLILAEQLYRALEIEKGSSYHKI